MNPQGVGRVLTHHSPQGLSVNHCRRRCRFGAAGGTVGQAPPYGFFTKKRRDFPAFLCEAHLLADFAARAVETDVLIIRSVIDLTGEFLRTRTGKARVIS